MQSVVMDNVAKCSNFVEKLRRSLGKRLRKRQERRDEQNRRRREEEQIYQFHRVVLDTTTKFLSFIQSVILWDNPVNSISVLTAFNAIFW